MFNKLTIDQVLLQAKSYVNKGKIAEAQGLYQSILNAFPNNIRAKQGLINLENQHLDVSSHLINLYSKRKFLDILNYTNHISEENSHSLVIWSIRGASAAQIGFLDDAKKAFKKCISLKPDYAEAYSNLGNVLKDQGKLDDAIKFFEKAIILKPNFAEAYNNMGVVLQDKGQYVKSVKMFKKAISLKPNYAEAYSNMGVTLHKLDKINEAIEAYNKAISLKPDYAVVYLNLSYSLLSNGKIKEGLAEYEWRWKTKNFVSQLRSFSQPLWNGKESLNGKRILLWCEQGIGDTINWSACLPFVASKAKRCIVECQDKLVPLLKRSFPNVDIKAVDKSLDLQRDDFDVHLPMGSLCKHFIEEIIKTPKPQAFLIPDTDRVNFWKERLKSLGKGPYIGLSWKSSSVVPYRLKHYPPLCEWSPILKVPDVTFINLQYVNFKGDLIKIQDELGIKVHNFDDLDHYNNIDDVAALSVALDMVVSTKVTPPFISSAVGTSTKIANWKQSSYNTIVTNPVTSSCEMYHKNTGETWDKVFNLIAQDVLKQKNKICKYE